MPFVPENLIDTQYQCLPIELRSHGPTQDSAVYIAAGRPHALIIDRENEGNMQSEKFLKGPLVKNQGIRIMAAVEHESQHLTASPVLSPVASHVSGVPPRTAKVRGETPLAECLSPRERRSST
jgi:hypothetical protein